MQVPKRRYEKNHQGDIDPYITQQKADEMEAEIEKMVKTIRPKLAKEVEEHAKNGDFSENAAYQAAKGKLRGLNYRVLVLQNNLNKAIIIKPEKNSKTIQIGNTVTVESNGKKFIYQILGSQEINLEQGIISHQSPIGSGLLDHKGGDEVELEINEKMVKYKILKIK